MPESFGARMRQRREERGIDLIAIAEQTKIKLALLEALERDDVSHWPSGIFRRAYIRTYAQFIGLDPDVVVREFLEVYPDPGDTFSALAASVTVDDGARRNASPPTRLRNIVDSAIDSLVRMRRPPASDSPPPLAVADHLNGFAMAAANLPLIPPSPLAAMQTPVVDDALPELESSLPLEPEPVSVAAVPEPTPEQQPIELPNPSLDDVPLSEPVVAPVAERAEEPSRSAPSEGAANDVKAGASPRDIQSAHESTLEAMAHLCTEFGRVVDRDGVQRLMQRSARVLDAAGLIVWLWDGMVEELRPALVHGYSDKVLAHLPAVSRDADNVTAAAFRAANACEMAATAYQSGALVVPLLTPDGCVGVLAIELHQGVQPTRSVRAVATVLAAALTQLVDRSRTAEVQVAVPQPAPAVAHSVPFRPARVRH